MAIPFCDDLKALQRAKAASNLLSQQPRCVAFMQHTLVSAPSADGSCHHNDQLGLQVSVGARIEERPLVDWSTSPFVVTALMPRQSGHRLLIGDRILSINGQNVTQISDINLLTGPLKKAWKAYLRIGVIKNCLSNSVGANFIPLDLWKAAVHPSSHLQSRTL